MKETEARALIWKSNKLMVLEEAEDWLLVAFIVLVDFEAKRAVNI